MTPPLGDTQLRDAVGASVESFIAQRSPAFADISPHATMLVEAVAGLITGGKRLRPAFAYWGHLAAGGDHSDNLISACAALELLQACALIHDDVMDASDTRRGKPAAHRAFEALHTSSGWHGDAAQFGVGAAILAGDLALSWADEMLLCCGLPEPQIAAGKAVYDTMRSELMAGQYLDLVEQQRRDITVDRARTVIKYKSAKYSVEQPILMGAAMAGAPTLQMSALSDFGLAVGEAFQLRDDLLGVFGDTATTGKPAGDDLRERKQTVLLALAQQSAGPRLAELLAAPTSTPEQVAEMQVLVAATDAASLVEGMIDTALVVAQAALDRADIGPEAHAALLRLAQAATRRKA